MLCKRRRTGARNAVVMEVKEMDKLKCDVCGQTLDFEFSKNTGWQIECSCGLGMGGCSTDDQTLICLMVADADR